MEINRLVCLFLKERSCMMASNLRECLVDAALGLFYKYGYRATGIEKILTVSGVSKMTLYKYFKSKDELILATLRRQDERIRNWLMREVEQRGSSPHERILAIFDALSEWISKPGFHGCPFMNVTAEYSEPGDPIHAFAAEHKRILTNYIYDLVKETGAPDPKGLAQQIMLLVDGAIVSAKISHSEKPAGGARNIADALLKAIKN